MNAEDIERKKLRNDTLRTLAAPLSILVAALAIGIPIVASTRAEQGRAEFGFQLEAAKAVMAEPTKPKAVAKADLLRALFPDRLPADFANVVDAFPDAFVKCMPGYTPCLPVRPDLSCQDLERLDLRGVRVRGEDTYNLDTDNDGRACER